MTMEKYLIKCENCGAMIDPLDATCPHCGAVNAVGGEFQYMDDLLEIREDVNNLSENQKDEYKKEVKKTVGLIGKTAKIVIIIIVLFALLFAGSSMLIDHLGGYNKSTEELMEQMKWEKETFPKLDEMYANGEYDALCDFQADNILDSKYSMSSWSHYSWLLEYNNYRYLLEDAERIKSGNYSEGTIKYCLIDMIRLVCNSDAYQSMDEADVEIMKNCQAELVENVLPLLEIDEKELNEIYQSCLDHDIDKDSLNYKKMEKTAKKFAKNYMKKHK